MCPGERLASVTRELPKPHPREFTGPAERCFQTQLTAVVLLTNQSTGIKVTINSGSSKRRCSRACRAKDQNTDSSSSTAGGPVLATSRFSKHMLCPLEHGRMLTRPEFLSASHLHRQAQDLTSYPELGIRTCVISALGLGHCAPW